MHCNGTLIRNAASDRASPGGLRFPRWQLLTLCAVICLGGLAPIARGQPRPYLGFVYPAGGQRGTTFHVKLGGQNLDQIHEVLVTGTGVSGRILQYFKPLNPQEMQLLNEQLRELKQGASEMPEQDRQIIIAHIEKRKREYCNQPQSRALASLIFVEMTIEIDALPGPRELRIRTSRGLSNPMVFHIGQLPEVCRKPMLTSRSQVLGKEEAALRNRPAAEAESQIAVPCIMNGQVAPGEVNRYCFLARKGQHLVISVLARQLIPYVADAVPGWFQPVLTVHDSHGKEAAYADDYFFKPDPAIVFPAPEDGEYVLSIHDSLFRGREDFVYRITIGELPFVTSIFPLGGRVGEPTCVEMKGWNLESATMAPPGPNAGPGIYSIAANKGGYISNRVPFALDTLPEMVEREPNNSPSHAQPLELPRIINGRVDKPDDWDVFAFSGKDGEVIVAEVWARRLDSPLDSVLQLTDSAGRLLASSDDVEDPGFGAVTHHADSYFMAKLPADGVYYLRLGDTTRCGGEEYAYRLRVSAPRPDFALRVLPSSLTLRSGRMAPVRIQSIRKDGFYGPIRIALTNSPGFSASPVTLFGATEVGQLTVRTDRPATDQPVCLTIVGTAKIGGQEVSREAAPAEDRMQAFLWRHLVPATELTALVFDPSVQPTPRRTPRERPRSEPKKESTPSDTATVSPKFTKEQIAARLRQLNSLFEEGLLTDDFYDAKVSELEPMTPLPNPP